MQHMQLDRFIGRITSDPVRVPAVLADFVHVMARGKYLDDGFSPSSP